jgi:hypothetical protein
MQAPDFDSSLATPSIGFAGGDVGLRAGLDEALRDHQADALPAAGDHGHFVLDGEEVIHSGVLSTGRPAGQRVAF